ncbi:GNAT family N-acetyltransferase [Actinokineospora sp.]|uniref:GNAT family N-acetyltransferase n=1 Tax=Actinokineospora sp. TaxID=1872133 RepID=UPI004037FFC6
MLEISALRPPDRAGWEVLARAYKAFYETAVPDADYERTWQRLLRADELHGVAARIDGSVVGIAHFLFHANVWSTGACYLQDLYVDEAARGRGAARGLIEQVAEVSRERGMPRLYWHTKQDNARARALYDRVAQFHGFLCYVYPM